MKLKSFLTNMNISVKEAMKQMDELGEKILFVVDKNRKLLGTLTDGDIRRWILADGDLTESIDRIYNRRPIYVQEDYNIDDVKKIMIEEKIVWIPIVGKNSKILDVLLWDNIFGEKKKATSKDLNMPVVIMGGGRGTRLDPFTRILPKPLIPIGDKPVIELIMDNFIEFGCKDFFLVLGHKSEMIRSYFNNGSNNYRVKFIQEDKPLGTVGGLRLLPEDLPENFFVTNCDVLIDGDYKEICDFHLKNNNHITIVGSVKHFRIPYGVMKISSGGILNELIEKPEYDFLVDTGMHVFKKEVISLIPKRGLFHITDLIIKLKAKKGKIGVYPVRERAWIDIGQWEEYKKAIEKLP